MLDTLRGIAICAMIATHLSPMSRLTALGHLPRFASAADWFVLLSGTVVGMRGERRFLSGQGLRSHLALLRRAGLLYLIHCLLTGLVLDIHHLTGRLDAPDVSVLGGALRSAWLVATLRVQPDAFMNILPLYVCFLLVAPLVLEAIRGGGAVAVALASAALWGVAQRWPSAIPLPAPGPDGPAFSLAAWQFTFVVGMLLGYYRHQVAAALRRPGRSRLVVGAGVLLFVAAQLDRPHMLPFRVAILDGCRSLVRKETWAPLEALEAVLLTLVAYGAIARWYATRAAARGLLARAIDRCLAAVQSMGRKSLRCFLVHLPFALVTMAVRGVSWPRWGQDVAAAAVIVIAYLGAQL